jgi:hypothetical protein
VFIMGIISGKWLFFICLIVAILVCSVLSSAADINEKIGNRLELKGSAVSADSIYLFVTGPGLPSNGVRLDNMQVPVVTGIPESFTVTDVTNDHWVYTWNTARQGFSLKEGIYTVYAPTRPVGKSDVNSAVYGTISVSLTNSGEPYLSSGTVFFNTTPVISEIFIDGQSVGYTPQTRGLTEGDHEIRFEHPGYRTLIEKIPVTPGSFTSMQRTLVTEPVPVIVTTVTTTPPATVPQAEPLTPSNPVTTKRAPLSVILCVLGISAALIATGVKKVRK